MKRLAMVVLLVILVWMTWRLGTSLSSDALGMAVGVVFGVLAGVPTALLVLASSRRQAQRDDDDDAPRTVTVTQNFYVTDNRRQLTIHPPAGGMPLLCDREREVAAQRERRFVVVGEREEL